MFARIAAFSNFQRDTVDAMFAFGFGLVHGGVCDIITYIIYKIQ